MNFIQYFVVAQSLLFLLVLKSAEFGGRSFGHELRQISKSSALRSQSFIHTLTTISSFVSSDLLCLLWFSALLEANIIMPPKKVIIPDPKRPKRAVAVKTNGYPPDQVRRFMELWRKGTKIRDIAAEVKIGLSTAYHWQRNCLETGGVVVQKQKPWGRPNRMTVEDEKALSQMLLERGWMDQKDMVKWLEETRGVKVSASTVCRLLLRNGWNAEVFKKAAAKEQKELDAQDG